MNFIILTLLGILAFPLYFWIITWMPTQKEKEIKPSWWSYQPNSIKFILITMPIILILCIVMSIVTGEWVMGILAFASAFGVGGVGALFLDEF